MGTASYSKFIKAIEDFSQITKNVTKICNERTKSYRRTGSNFGSSVGGMVDSYFGVGGTKRGEGAGSFFGAIIGETLGEAIADSRNKREKEEAIANIKKMLLEWKKEGLPVINAYVETCEMGASIHAAEIQYFIDKSALESSAVSEQRIKADAFILRQCIASQYRDIYDVTLGKNIIIYFNNYLRHINNLETFAEWQNKRLSVSKISCYKAAYDNVVNAVCNEFSGIELNNFERVLMYVAAEVPAFIGISDEPYESSVVKSEAIRCAEAVIRRKTYQQEKFIDDFDADGKGFIAIANIAENSFRSFIVSVIKPDVLHQELIALILTPVFMLLNLIIRIYKWFKISNPFLRFFLCKYWGNVLLFIIIAQIIILILSWKTWKKFSDKPFNWKGPWNNFESMYPSIRNNACDAEMNLPPLKISTSTSKKVNSDDTVTSGSMSDDELMRLAGQ